MDDATAAGDEPAAVAPPRRFSHVRVLCLDADGDLLLMKWRDPLDGHERWEPPGGAVDPGESLLQAATRELREETGIEAPLREAYVVVHRDDTWEGHVRDRDEAVFFAAVGEAEVVPDMPTADERSTLVEWRFVRPSDVDRLDAVVYPPDPFALLSELLGC